MKVPDKNMNKKDKVKRKGGVNKPKPKKEQVLVVAQEIKYARLLSGNDKKTRDRVLKALKKWILNCFEKGHEFKEDDFTRVWKGLFYAVWMSDKPLVQEELCENIANVLDLFPAEQLKHALLMTKAGFKVLATEWYGIDHHRMDKFLMLVRRYLRGSLRCLRRCEWSLPSCQKYAKMLSGSDGLFALTTPHYARNATSMLLHVTDCFLEELAKVSEGDIPEASVCALLRPFVRYTCAGAAPALCTAARRVLTALLRQSAAGLQYHEKTLAWKQLGCPEGGPDAMEPASDEEGGEENDAESDVEDVNSARPLDPRAGRVDVELPLLPVPASLLADMLRGLLARASAGAHRRVKICLERFETLSRGQYPLPLSAPAAPAEPPPRPARAAAALRAFEHQLKVDADELKLRGLSRKHRKRLLKKSRAGQSIVEDVDDYKKSLSKESNNGEWLVESTETKLKKTDKDISNKENQDKSKKNAKLGAQKRKDKTELQNGDVSNKKQKLEKNVKSNLVNGENKKDLIVNKNLNKKDKINKLAKSEKDVKEIEAKVIPKQTDTSVKTNTVKNVTDASTKANISTVKEIKTKKPKNQPQIISLKSDNVKTGTKAEPSKVEVLKPNKPKITAEKPTFLVNKVKLFQKQLPSKEKESVITKMVHETPKKVKFILKNNSMQKPIDYYKSVKLSPNIPFDSSKQPCKTNLKPSTPSPINPFFKKKLRMNKLKR